MYVTINPINEQLKEIVKKHGASGWVVLRNTFRDGTQKSLVCKDNKMLELKQSEIK